MKTWQAALAHAGIGALQAVAGVPILDPHSNAGALANPLIQIGVQSAFLALQGIVAKKNSDTAPDGSKLVQTVDGNFVSTDRK